MNETDTAAFYRPETIQNVALTITEPELRRLRAALPERITVPATFRCGETTLESVGVRYKGNSSSGPNQQHKRGYLVHFDSYRPGQRFLGLERISLDNAVQFGSLFSEPILTAILRDLTIPTYRCNYATLTLNGSYQGVYTNVERLDGVFVRNHLPDPDGLLFKVDEGGPGGNLAFLGDDPTAYAKTFAPETKPAKKDPKALVALLKLIQRGSPTELAAQFEIDALLKTMAVLLLGGAFDQLTGWNPHNYYLYCDTKRNRWRYLPWDLDVGFCELAFGQIRVLEDWNAAWPVVGGMPNPLLERVIADPVLRERYRAEARAILEKYFEPQRLSAVLDAHYARIKKALATDPFPPRRITNPDDRSYETIIGSMKRFFERRYRTARQQLDNPGSPPPPVRRPQGPPPSLVAKIQRVMRAAEQRQRAGKDVRPIQQQMEKVGPLLQAGRFDEAEKRLDLVLKSLGDGEPLARE